VIKHTRLHERKLAASIGPDWIGVHVRHSDSGDAVPWPLYLHAAKIMRAKYRSKYSSLSKIYLATDDQQVAEECEKGAAAKNAGFTCIVSTRMLLGHGSSTE
jgi:hypothetical protein